QMKATGEVMSIADSFEGALMKAIRSLEQHVDSLLSYDFSSYTDEQLRRKLTVVDDQRIFAIAEALRRGYAQQEINDLTQIDIWFIDKIAVLVEMERALTKEPLTTALLKEAKRLEFPDAVIASLCGATMETIRARRETEGIRPIYKMVDTCAAEFEAATPYYYSVYPALYDLEPECEVLASKSKCDDFTSKSDTSSASKVLVLGSGPIRIGQGIEFDYCSVHATWAFSKAGYETIIINNNPETVSTDFDIADKLYFEPLTPEDVEAIVLTEGLETIYGAVVQFGGQTAIKLTKSLMEMGVTILGTKAEDVDAAEDRELFDQILEQTDIPRAAGGTVYTAQEAIEVARRLGYPVLVRPSYVLGGQGMQIAICDEDIVEFMEIINRIAQDHPILVDKYLSGKEIEVDAVCDGTDILIPGIMEHIERSGVHSGDSISVYPPPTITSAVRDKIAEYSRRLAKALHVKGLINIQFIGVGDDVYVIEVNPRSSRTVPYISKVTGIPIVDLATEVILGKSIRELGYEPGLQPESPYYAVKMPVFSFEKIRGAEISLGPEMKSTGECLGIAKSFTEALYKAFLGAGVDLPKHKNMIITVKDSDKEEAAEIAARFEALGYTIYATKSTADAFIQRGIRVRKVNKINEESPTIMDLILGHRIDLVIDTPTQGRDKSRDGFLIRRTAIEAGVTCLTALDTARALVTSLENRHAFVSLVDVASI
ncbi:MAG: carbamoyl-phosphate synthase large subunit, partial [Clostridium sp.]|nr:carbamoyl-phosphate synthase large subunit [Clostridium sp.]